MAVVGATITDDALFGIPDPDYGDDSDDDVKQPDKQPVTTTLSNESNKSNTCGDRSSTSEQPGNNEQQQQHDERSPRNSTEDETAQRISYTDDDDGRKFTDDINSKHSPDVSGGALSIPLHDSNRGSGSRSPGPIMGVSHEHVAVDPVLIGAKKVPSAPPQLTKEQKELQKELQFKQKQGNMLEKKPELKKAMDDRKFKMKKEEQKRDQENKQSTFNVKMGQQAMKLLQLEEEEEKKKSVVSKTNSSPSEQQLDEFKKVHSKIHKNKT